MFNILFVSSRYCWESSFVNNVSDYSNSLDVYYNASRWWTSSFHISEVLAHITVLVLLSGCFPNKWNISYIIPVFKKGEKGVLGKYRDRPTSWV